REPGLSFRPNADKKLLDKELTAPVPAQPQVQAENAKTAENKRVIFSNLFYLCVLSELRGEKYKNEEKSRNNCQRRWPIQPQGAKVRP
ncbi:unnamed protein product, partial [marine sediment metagenome]